MTSVKTKFNNCYFLYISFPEKIELRNLWIEATEKKNWTPKKWSLLCSLHFEKKYIDRFGRRAYLRKNAVPTIFNQGNERTIRNLVRSNKKRVCLITLLNFI